MLYDPKWEKQEVKADPMSLSTLIAWLEKQPSGKEYDYVDTEGCVLCQYFRAQGFDVERISSNVMTLRTGGDLSFPPAFDWDVANYPHCGSSTLGAALSRARALAAQS